jgi:hypothetical protein
MKAYHIKDWDRDRENSDTRRYQDLLWFRNKVKLLGEGLGHTLGQPDKQGPFLYGMFKILEQIAAAGRQGDRGWLVRNGSALDADRMGNLVRLPTTYFTEALKFFSTAPMDWLELADFPVKESPRNPGVAADDPDTARTPRGESPRNPGVAADDPDTARRNSTTGERTNVRLRTNDQKRERERIDGGFASKGEARKAQLQQFASAQARKRELEGLTEELSQDQEEEMKKMRALVKAIQKKQRGGDFTPVEPL